MTNAELKEYLDGFPDGAQVSVILANPKKRKLYKIVNAMCITDFDQPVFCIEVGKESNMDAELVAACKECEQDAEKLAGQMQIEDFPEVMS